MKKSALLTITITIAATCIFTAACSAIGKAGGRVPAESSVIIDKEGDVSWASVEPFGSADGTEEELRAWLEQEISYFNGSLDKGSLAVNTDGAEKLPVAISSITISKDTATLITEYDTPSRLVEFAQERGDYNVPFTVLEAGRVATIGQGFDGVTFRDAKGGEIDAQTARASNEKMALKAEGQGLISTEQDILYVSDGCTLKDSNTVQTAAEGTSFIVFK